MALFSSFRVAPGVRISTSSRGLRAHVGPRAARLHVGGGGTGISTGAGPLTAYSGLGASKPRRATTAARSDMTPAQAEKARRVDEAAQAWAELAQLHRIEFAPVRPPGPVTAEPVPMFGVLLAQAERRQMSGVGRFDRPARQDARARARAEAEEEALALLTAAIEDRSVRQEASDQAWTSLVAGEPAVVAAVVHDALEARGVESVVASSRVGHVQLDLQVPGSEAIPAQQPSLTPSGAPTLRKLTKTDAAQHVRQHVAARVLLAGKEALAQSPAITRVEVSACRGRDTLLRARLPRAAMAAAPWALDAWDVLVTVDPDVEANIGGRTQELRALT